MEQIAFELLCVCVCKVGDKVVMFYAGNTECYGGYWFLGVIGLTAVYIFFIGVFAKLYYLPIEMRKLDNLCVAYKQEYW